MQDSELQGGEGRRFMACYGSKCKTQSYREERGGGLWHVMVAAAVSARLRATGRRGEEVYGMLW